MRLSLLVFAALTGGFASAATSKPKYSCETDADCTANFADTVCISVEVSGEVTKKCTPNTAKRPACRGAQPGLCPSYQSADIGYLNAHCVFVVDDQRLRGRWLMADATNKSGDSSSGDEVVVDTTQSTGSSSDDLAKVKIGKETLTGRFKCVDMSECEDYAYDPSTCEPTTCGSPGSKSQCSNQGTCTYGSAESADKRLCKCYSGYAGTKCQQEVSNECDVDCGPGGDCVNGKCKCKKGYDGAAYKGKKGKTSQRCTRCTNDLACANGGTCNTDKGVCECALGFSGPTCGSVEDSCTSRTCGIGNCILFENETSACFCPRCIGDVCTRCTTQSCSECESTAFKSSMTWVTVVVTVAAILICQLLNDQL